MVIKSQLTTQSFMRCKIHANSIHSVLTVWCSQINLGISRIGWRIALDAMKVWAHAVRVGHLMIHWEEGQTRLIGAANQSTCMVELVKKHGMVFVVSIARLMADLTANGHGRNLTMLSGTQSKQIVDVNQVVSNTNTARNKWTLNGVNVMAAKIVATPGLRMI